MPARALIRQLGKLGGTRLNNRRSAADLSIKAMGIIFTVYSDADMIDRAWPFDVLPRTIGASEWRRVHEGLLQRVTARNMFIADLHGKQRIMADGVFSREVLEQSVTFARNASVLVRRAT